MTSYLATQPKTTCCVSSKLGPGRVSSTSLMCLQPGLSSCCTSRTDSGPYTVCTYAMSCGLCTRSGYWELLTTVTHLLVHVVHDDAEPLAED